MDWIAQVAPVEVKEGNIARCKGGASQPSSAASAGTHTAASAGPDPNLGHPVEYIVLNDTSKCVPGGCGVRGAASVLMRSASVRREYPAVCKYCRNTYYMAAHHH